MAERTVSATEARVHFGELLDSVVSNLDIVYVARAGRPQVVIVSVEQWRRHAKKEDDPWAEFAEVVAEHDTYMAEALSRGHVEDFDAAELLRVGREERDERLSGDLRGRKSDHQARTTEATR